MHSEGPLPILLSQSVEFVSVLYFMIVKTAYYVSALIFTYISKSRQNYIAKLGLPSRCVSSTKCSCAHCLPLLVPTVTSTGEFSMRLSKSKFRSNRRIVIALKFSKYVCLQWRNTMFSWHQLLFKGMLTWAVQNKVCSFLQTPQKLHFTIYILISICVWEVWW